MARPAEKARSMMNKWVAMRDGDTRVAATRNKSRRPHLASECDHLADAERFRVQILREISDNIRDIQNPALPEHEVRELNDTINQRLREKYHWNRRIMELGGQDYNALEKQRQVEAGDSQRLSGYRYFGVAKDLPGVKELLLRQATEAHQTSKGDLHKHVTADYFGWRDEEDGVLLELEEAATMENDKIYPNLRPLKDGVAQDWDADHVASYLSDVASPDEIAKLMLEHKKRAMLDKYAL